MDLNLSHTVEVLGTLSGLAYYALKLAGIKNVKLYSEIIQRVEDVT